MDAKEMASKLKVETGSVIRALNSMYKYEEVFKRVIKRGNHWIYQWKK